MHLLFFRVKIFLRYVLWHCLRLGILSSIFNEDKIIANIFSLNKDNISFKGNNALPMAAAAVDPKGSRKKYFNNGIHLMQNHHRICQKFMRRGRELYSAEFIFDNISRRRTARWHKRDASPCICNTNNGNVIFIITQRSHSRLDALCARARWIFRAQ